MVGCSGATSQSRFGSRAWAFLAAVLTACAGPKGTGPVAGDDSAATGDTASDGFVPFAVPLAGCSWHHTAAAVVGDAVQQVAIDSGSTTLAVSAVGCTTCEDAGVLALYDPTHGTDEGESAAGMYASGSGWSGEVYGDTVALSGIAPAALHFAAVSRSDMFGPSSCDADPIGSPSAVDGIIGLAPDVWLVPGTDSYVSTLAADGTIPDAFALRLCHVGGTLWLGGYDGAETTGGMTYAPIASGGLFDGAYQVSVYGFELLAEDGTSVAVAASQTGSALPALLDSGGPSLIVPDSAYVPLIAAISGDPAFAEIGDATWWAYGTPTVLSIPPTEFDTKLPRFIVHLAGGEGMTLSMPASESYLSAYANADGTYTYSPNLYSDALFHLEDYADVIDLGNLPMYSYVVYTDRANQQIGFAPAIPCP